MTVDADLIAFANRLADASGAVIRPFFRQRIDVAHKEGKARFRSRHRSRSAAPSAPSAN